MNRARWAGIVLLLAGGCSGGTEKPGAVLRSPGALAIFDGIVDHGSGSLRPYLAVANERGDELRLVDTTDYDVVTSPGLTFPLSVPSAGRPLLLAAADLGELPAGTRPDALAVVAAGSNVIELVDTWSGQPTVVATVDLGAGVEILSMAATPLPDGAGGAVAGAARLVVGLAGDDLAVIELTRVGLTDEIVAGSPVIVPLGFEAVSLAPGKAPDVLYAASRDLLPPAFTAYGVSRITLPAGGGASFVALDARVPTEQVAAVTFDGWDFPTPGTPQADTWGPAVERVVAVPVAGTCGAPPKPVRCGLLAIDPLAGGLEPDPLGEGTEKLPIPIPAPIAGLVATGRAVAAQIFATSSAGTVATTGLAAVSALDGKVYLVDLARWVLLSDTSPLVGASRTRVSAAEPFDVAGGSVGLWGLGGAAPRSRPSALEESLAARIRVTPGFTTDEQWKLTWQGVLPNLERRGAVLGRDGAGDAGLWLAVEIDTAPGAPLDPADLVGVADLALLGVMAGDLVEIGGDASPCPAGTELAVDAVVALAQAPGGAIRFTPPLPACLSGALAVGETGAEVATVRSKELVLTGSSSGHVGRPVASTSMAPEFPVPGRRLFYLADDCTSVECVGNWPGLSFPYPEGPAVALVPAFLTEAGLPTSTPPARGAGLSFFTASGRAPSGRHPTSDGSAISSALPSGMALLDKGLAGTGARVYTSYVSGLVMSFSTASTPGSMKLIR